MKVRLTIQIYSRPTPVAIVTKRCFWSWTGNWL